MELMERASVLVNFVSSLLFLILILATAYVLVPTWPLIKEELAHQRKLRPFQERELWAQHASDELSRKGTYAIIAAIGGETRIKAFFRKFHWEPGNHLWSTLHSLLLTRQFASHRLASLEDRAACATLFMEKMEERFKHDLFENTRERAGEIEAYGNELYAELAIFLINP